MKCYRLLLLATMISGVLITADADSGCRYLWVVRNDLTSRESIDVLLNRAEISGANGLIVQVMGRGEAYYISSIIPSADFDSDFDPLEYIIIQARMRNGSTCLDKCFSCMVGSLSPRRYFTCMAHMP